mgnify:CR=1 FL=1
MKILVEGNIENKELIKNTDGLILSLKDYSVQSSMTYTLEEIKEIEIVGKKRQYYVLKFAIGNMVTNVPIENSEEIGIRPVIEKQEAKKALQYFRDAELEDDANWNKRQRDNLIKIKSGDIYQVLLVLKELMYREKIKGLSTSERKTLTSAKQIVVSELVLSEVADVSDIESILNDTVDALVWYVIKSAELCFMALLLFWKDILWK